MAGEAVGQEKSFEFRPLAEDGIVVQGVDRIEARPPPNQLQPLEGRNEFGQFQPQLVHEPVLVPGKIETHRVLVHGFSQQYHATGFRPEVEPGRQDCQGQRALWFNGRIQAETLSFDRIDGQFHPGGPGQRGAPGTGAVDHDG